MVISVNLQERQKAKLRGGFFVSRKRNWGKDKHNKGKRMDRKKIFG